MDLARGLPNLPISKLASLICSEWVVSSCPSCLAKWHNQLSPNWDCKQYSGKIFGHLPWSWLILDIKPKLESCQMFCQVPCLLTKDCQISTWGKCQRLEDSLKMHWMPKEYSFKCLLKRNQDTNSKDKSI